MPVLMPVFMGALIVMLFAPPPALAVNAPPASVIAAPVVMEPLAVCMVNPPYPRLLMVAPALVTIAPFPVALSVKEYGLFQAIAFCTDRKSTRLNSSHLVISYA